ncbi:MAG: UDP-glucose 4-epimerase GalE [Chloroflexota bacterium]
MSVLVTGGAGYIGSHTCVELLQAGFEVVVVDNLSNSSKESLERVEEITSKQVMFYEVDLLDKAELEKIFTTEKIEAVVHFAALKAVGESVQIPLRYYENNIVGTMHLLELMEKYQVNNIVFSSSATVYGEPESVPIREDFPVKPTNPYGWTKLMIEQMLHDLQSARPEMNIAVLRYFNPVGAHVSGLIGESPNGIPNNIMPYISQVAVSRLEKLSVFGDDYPTADGTGVRDYIHVVDLAKGHIAALRKLETNPGYTVYNLGRGQGYSVFELIKAFETAAGTKIPFEVIGRREGDVPESYADSSKANRELGWKAELDIDQMCADTWRWQSMNPEGYQ